MIEKYESRRIRVAIRHVLMDFWDPIGVKDAPTAWDEYDGYIGKVFEMLTGGATDQEIAAHLLWIERERMELPNPGSSISRTIVALRAIELPTESK